MKNFVLIVLLSLSFSYGRAQVIENLPLLTVTGEAVVKAVPDQVIVAVRIQRKVDIESLTTVSDAFLFSKEQTDIKFVGNNDNEILTTLMEASTNDKTVVFIKEFIITIRNPENLTRVLMELLRHDFTNVYSISYRLSNPNDWKDKARREAMTHARATASLYARELGQTIGKAHLVKEEETQPINWFVEKYRPDIRELISTSYHFNPGYITIPCKVTVSFNLIE